MRAWPGGQHLDWPLSGGVLPGAAEQAASLPFSTVVGRENATRAVDRRWCRSCAGGGRSGDIYPVSGVSLDGAARAEHDDGRCTSGERTPPRHIAVVERRLFLT
jgi:hypothetical protein